MPFPDEELPLLSKPRRLYSLLELHCIGLKSRSCLASKTTHKPRQKEFAQSLYQSILPSILPEALIGCQAYPSLQREDVTKKKRKDLGNSLTSESDVQVKLCTN